MLDDMLDKGFLRPSASAYGAPVLFVPKPDGTLRMVLDYRDLNAQTVKDRYPLPRDHDLFDQLQHSRAQLLSKMDLLYGYWQVLMHPDDIHKTAIRTPLGSYEYVVMPMGLTNAPATFQRMMEAVLRPFLTDFCMVYLDDIIVYSRTEEEHVEHILSILEALHRHGLKIKLKKCELFRTVLPFLGHIINVESQPIKLLPDPAKTAAIEQWAEPENNTELQSFIGAVNYYSKMIDKFAEKAAPLTSIQSKKWNATNKSEFWTKEHSESFDILRRALTQAPILALPVPDKPFILQTDASNTALGGVLMQEDEDNNRRVVTYFSKKFSPAERNWPVHERELFGLVYALRKFRHYLMGAEVAYEGDHKPLAWINTQKNLSQRQARWLETLASFDWVFKHVPGKDLVSMTTIMHRLQQAYQRDELAKAVLQGEERHGFVVQRGIVMRFDSDQHRFPCIYVPSDATELQQLIMQEHHEVLIGGHLGAAKTYEKVRRSFFWVKMKEDIEAYVKSCASCQRAKRRTTKPPGANVPFPIPELPFEIIAMDMKSGLPKTSRGNDAFWVVVDKLTRRAHVIPCSKSCTAADVARMVFDNVVRHWGVPCSIISDRDPRFIAAFWQELWQLVGTKLNMSTAEHPQTDGSSERFIGTIAGMVRARAITDSRDWDIWIGALEFAYNDSVHPVTGFTPFQLSIGRDPSMPMTMLLNGVLQRPAMYAQTEQFVDPQVYLHKFTGILTAAKQELRRRQRTQHQELLQRASYPVHYDPGDYVWMEASTLRTPLSTLAPRRHGPYRVIRKVGLNAYELDFGDGSKRHNPVNEEKLSPYLDRNTRLPWPSQGVLPGTPASAAQLPRPPPPPTPGRENDINPAIDATPVVPTPGLEVPGSGPAHNPQVTQDQHIQAPKKYSNKNLKKLEDWREKIEGDTMKAEVLARYGNNNAVWRDLYDVLHEGGFKQARHFLQERNIQHPHLWRSGLRAFQGKQYPFITAEYQMENTENEPEHRPYFVVYSDKDRDNLTPEQLADAENQPTESPWDRLGRTALGSLAYVLSKHKRPPRMLELCSGTKSASKALKRMWPNAKVITLDSDPRYSPTILADVTDWRYKEDVFNVGYFDIIWASPPCTEYSVAKTKGVRDLVGADHVVKSVRNIISYFDPAVWFIENPHALLHLRPVMRDIDDNRYTTTYCQYGTDYRKETDIWTNIPVQLRHCLITPCAHVVATGSHPRTAQTGTSNTGAKRGTPRDQAYQVPQPLLTVLIKAALRHCGYQL